MGIVKPKFTRRNEIWSRIKEIEDLAKNVRKTEDRTSLSSYMYEQIHVHWVKCFENTDIIVFILQWTWQKYKTSIRLFQTLKFYQVIKWISLYLQHALKVKITNVSKFKSETLSLSFSLSLSLSLSLTFKWQYW